MMKKSWYQSLVASPWGFILCCFGVAALLGVILFPEFFIFHNLEFCYATFWTDYWGSFTLTNFFYHGGIQLWDPYDQLPLAYYYLSLGIFKFFNIVVALVYILLSPFCNYPAEFFHHVFSIVFFLSNVFLKLIGSYLLFRKFTTSRPAVAIASVYYAVIASGLPFIATGLSKRSSDALVERPPRKCSSD